MNALTNQMTADAYLNELLEAEKNLGIRKIQTACIKYKDTLDFLPKLELEINELFNTTSCVEYENFAKDLENTFASLEKWRVDYLQIPMQITNHPLITEFYSMVNMSVNIANGEFITANSSKTISQAESELKNNYQNNITGLKNNIVHIQSERDLFEVEYNKANEKISELTEDIQNNMLERIQTVRSMHDAHKESVYKLERDIAGFDMDHKDSVLHGFTITLFFVLACFVGLFIKSWWAIVPLVLGVTLSLTLAIKAKLIEP